jgi:hypothetical protein
MISLLGSPYSQAEIRDALATECEAVQTFFADIEQDLFFQAPPDIWSPAQNLVHLIQSVSPVVQALNLPKMALRLRFGRAKHESRTFAEVRYIYVNEALAGGGVAGGSFLPEVKEESAVERERILAKWQEKGAALVDALDKWDEQNLDGILLPHPLLDEMTVREILFFTLYHNMHHVRDVQRLLGLTESEWFETVVEIGD